MTRQRTPKPEEIRKPPPPPAPPARSDQPTLPGLTRSEPKPETGRELRDLAIDRVERHAGERWIDRALEVVRICAVKYPDFTSDDVHRIAADLDLPKPPDPRAWGPVMMNARRNGWISKTGHYRESTRPVCHAAPKPVYQSHLVDGGPHGQTRISRDSG